MRCELVPDFVEEEAFWSVYFYRIYQFKHSMGLLPSIQQVATAIEQQQKAPQQSVPQQQSKRTISDAQTEVEMQEIMNEGVSKDDFDAIEVKLD